MRRFFSAVAVAVGVSGAAVAVVPSAAFAAVAAPAASTATHKVVMYTANAYFSPSVKPARFVLQDGAIRVSRVRWRLWGSTRAVTSRARMVACGNGACAPAVKVKITLNQVHRHGSHKFFRYMRMRDLSGKTPGTILYCFSYTKDTSGSPPNTGDVVLWWESGSGTGNAC